MDARPADSRAVLRRLVQRLDVDALVEELTRRAAELPAYQRFVRDDHGAADRGRAALRWNIDLFTRWLTEGTPPGDDDLERLHELIGARVSEGMPMEEGLLVYRRNARAGWDLLVELADAEERAALLAGADVLLEYVNAVTDAFARLYAEQDDPAVVAGARDARRLLERLVDGAPLDAADVRRAEALGLPVQDGYRPFAVHLAGRTALDHDRLAGRLRRAGVLAVTEAHRVVGLAAEPVDRETLVAAPGDVVLVEDEAVGRDRLGVRLDDARRLLDVARHRGLRGVVRPAEHLTALLLAAAPDHADRIAARVLAPLTDDLQRTLAALAEHDFDRSAAARALPVHRNTLRYRATKIEQLTGLDLGRGDDRVLVWLATARRRDRGERSP